MNKTAIGVVLFIIIIIIAGFSAREAKSDEFGIGLGQSVINSHIKTAEFSYRNDGNWEFAASLMGEGDTKNGVQGITNIYSASYIVEPQWSFLGGKNYYRLGGAYVNDSPLVGPTNYRLGVGMDWDVFSLEYVHYSSSGIHDLNTGIDMIVLKYHIPN